MTLGLFGRCEHQRASIRAQRELSKRHAEESRIKLKEQNERSDQVVRAWAKKQQNLNKTKNRARRNRIARDQRFIEDSKSVINHLRTYDSTPPVELMHASTALAKLKKEEKRAKKEGRTVSGASSGGEDDDAEEPVEVKTVMEMKATITVSSIARALWLAVRCRADRRGVFCSQIGAPAKGRSKQRSSKKQLASAAGGAEEEPPPKPAPVVAAPPSFNPLAASGYELSTRPGSGKSGSGARSNVPLEVDSHMLLDEETEFQLSRLESQQDDLEDWSRSLQHQLPTIKGV